MKMIELQLSVETDDLTSNVFEKSASAPSSPSDGTKGDHGCIVNSVCRSKSRRVTFPDDETIVTGYFDPPDPWSDDYKSTTDNMITSYRAACWKQGVKPLLRLLQQLQGIQMYSNREYDLNLKGENLDAQHCEALEEIFKRIQFKRIELEGCHLDDEGSAAIFDMIEYYDSATHLNISFNKSISNQGWQACSKMLKKTPCLQYLDARGTGQNEQSLMILGRALRTGTSLVTIHLENCGLSSRPLVILVAALKLNTTLLELYLGENKMSPADGLQLGNLLKTNTVLELLDLQCNNLQDLGLCHLVDGLCQQLCNFGEGLKTVVLWNNHLTHIGMQHINRSLLTSKNLKNLDLGYNNISNEGIHQLKQGLLNSQTLQNLGLQNAKITCEGAVALAEYIADNQHITKLDLRDNNIKVAGLMALALSMKHNHSLIHLDLDQCIKKDPHAPDGVHNYQRLLQEIEAYCQRNKYESDHLQDNNMNCSQLEDVPFERLSVASDPSESYSVDYSELINNQSTQHLNHMTHFLNSQVPLMGMVTSASFPSATHSLSSHSSHSSRNRFHVCKVFLDTNKSESENKDYIPKEIDTPNSRELSNAFSVDHKKNFNAGEDKGQVTPSVSAKQFESVMQLHNVETSEQSTSFISSDENSRNVHMDRSEKTFQVASEFKSQYHSENLKNSLLLSSQQQVPDHVQSSSRNENIQDTESFGLVKPSVQKDLLQSEQITFSPEQNILDSQSAHARELFHKLDLLSQSKDIHAETHEMEVVPPVEQKNCAEVLSCIKTPKIPSSHHLHKSNFVNSETVQSSETYNAPQSSQINEQLINKSNTVKLPKKIAFLLPDVPETPKRSLKDRRMSTPALPSASIQRSTSLTLKLGRQLESLDLRSSVPLSPTRLLEGWAFPDPPIEMELPSQIRNPL